jgi:predicted aminopeptidase
MEPKSWCFPVTGCVSYRGYFNEEDALSMANTLRLEGWEASVYPVPAYSTLGKTNWLGGDPLLSTFIDFPQGELARMIFHELAHQVLYVPNDTAFNESFASAVERLGSTSWLAEPAHAAALQESAAFEARRRDFRALTTATRKKLDAVYGNSDLTTDQRETQKAAAYAEFRADYEQAKLRWGGYSRYDKWVANANNASFATLAAYDAWVDAFETLFSQYKGDWVAFYRAAQGLAQLPREERIHRLQQLSRSLSGR